MSPNRRAWCAAAGPLTLTTSASCSRVRLAARSAMSLRSHSAAGIIVLRIAHATSAHGGSRPASTRSRSLAGFGRRRADWDGGDPNERHYLGRVWLPRLLSQFQRTRTSARPQRRKKKPAYRTFPACRVGAAGWSGDDDVET